MTLNATVTVWIVVLLVPLALLWQSWRRGGAHGGAQIQRTAPGEVQGAHVQAVPLLNVSERTVYERLVPMLSDRYRAMPSVRLLDVLDVDGEGPAVTALRSRLMGHVDLLVVDRSYRPVVALEIDGPFHAAPAQRRRDRMKDAALAAAGIPLVRLPALGRRSGQDLQRQLAPYLEVHRDD